MRTCNFLRESEANSGEIRANGCETGSSYATERLISGREGQRTFYAERGLWLRKGGGGGERGLPCLTRTTTETNEKKANAEK